MTRLEIEPRVATKAAVFRGAVASGEAVDVTVRGAAAWTAGALRLRILGELDGEVATLAQFPMPAEDGGQADAWAVDGEDARCLLNLDTVQMERSVPCGAAERRLLVLDDPRGQTLYVKDLLPIAHWPRAKGEDVPVDLGGYRDLIAEVEGALAEEVRRAKAAEMLNAEEAARAKGAADTHAARTDNPHGVTAGQVDAYTKDEVDATYRTKQDLFVHERRITGKITNDKSLSTTAFTALSSGLSEVVDGTYSETYRCGVGGGVLSFSFIFRIDFSLPSCHDVGYVFEGTAFEDLKVKYDNATGIYSCKLENPGSDVTYTVSFSLSGLLYAATRLATFAELGEAKRDISTKVASKADKTTTLAAPAGAVSLTAGKVTVVDGSAGTAVSVTIPTVTGTEMRLCELLITGVTSDGALAVTHPANCLLADGADAISAGANHFVYAEYQRDRWLVTKTVLNGEAA